MVCGYCEPAVRWGLGGGGVWRPLFSWWEALETLDAMRVVPDANMSSSPKTLAQ